MHSMNTSTLTTTSHHTVSEIVYIGLISPFDSHAARTMNITLVQKTKSRAEQGTLTEWTLKLKTKKCEDPHDEEPIFKIKSNGRYGTVICGEGHRIRYIHTKTHTSITQLKAKMYWFLTATLIMKTALWVILFILIWS